MTENAYIFTVVKKRNIEKKNIFLDCVPFFSLSNNEFDVLITWIAGRKKCNKKLINLWSREMSKKCFNILRGDVHKEQFYYRVCHGLRLTKRED